VGFGSPFFHPPLPHEAATMNFTCSLPTQFVGLVRDILKAYNLDLNRDYLWLRLEKDDSDEILVIEKLDRYRATISTYKIDSCFTNLSRLR
jgi:hypothetical protein